MKRRLKAAREELEQHGLLEPLTPEERYSTSSGASGGYLHPRTGGAVEPSPGADSGNWSRSVKSRGQVGGETAAELVESHPQPAGSDEDRASTGAAQRATRGSARRTRGLLVASIRADYPGSRRFVSGDAEAKVQEAERGRRRGEAQEATARPGTRATSPVGGPSSAPPAERLPDAEREAIPSPPSRPRPPPETRKRMLEPLCSRAGGPAQDAARCPEGPFPEG